MSALMRRWARRILRRELLRRDVEIALLRDVAEARGAILARIDAAVEERMRIDEEGL